MKAVANSGIAKLIVADPLRRSRRRAAERPSLTRPRNAAAIRVM